MYGRGQILPSLPPVEDDMEQDTTEYQVERFGAQSPSQPTPLSGLQELRDPRGSTTTTSTDSNPDTVNGCTYIQFRPPVGTYKASVLCELIALLRQAPVAYNNKLLDYRLKSLRPSLKSSVYSHDKLPALHSSNVLQQMCRILLPPPPNRITHWLRMLTDNSLRSRHSYLSRRLPHRRTSNTFSVTSTTYMTLNENGIPHMNDDCVVSRTGLVSLSCAPSCHNLNAYRNK